MVATTGGDPSFAPLIGLETKLRQAGRSRPRVPIRVYGVVPKMSLTPGRVWRGAPSIGDDTTDILTNLLNLNETEIATLYREGAVHRTEPFTTPQVDAVHP